MRTRVLFRDAWPVLAAALALSACKGAEGPVVQINTVEPGDDCANGGLEVVTGTDDDGDGAITGDEVASSDIVCNGATGEEGSPGMVSRVTVLDEFDEVCPHGGLQTDWGVDDGAGGGTAGDGVLQDGEVDGTEYACNGAPTEHGTDNEPPTGPAGAFTVDLAGGAGSHDSGGNGGDLEAFFSYGSIGGGVKVFPTGEATNHLVFPSTVATYLGPVPAVVSSDLTVPVDPDTNDLGDGALYQVSYDTSPSAFGYLHKWDDSEGSGERVTGVRVEAGATLTLLDSAGTLGAGAVLRVDNDLHLAGTLTTDDGDGGKLSADLVAGTWVGEATGRVDLSGGTSEDGGLLYIGGFRHVYDVERENGAIYNRATLDVSGGDGAQGGNGGEVVLMGQAATFNEGPIDASGGVGTTTCPAPLLEEGPFFGRGGAIRLGATFGNVLNTADLVADGGACQATDGKGGRGGEIFLGNVPSEIANDTGQGWVVNTGSLSADGGSIAPCTDECYGGRGGDFDVLLYSSGFVNTGDISLRGGDAPGPASPSDESSRGGFGGVVTIDCDGDEDAWAGSDYVPSRDVVLSGNFDLSGGDGMQGGNGGELYVEHDAEYMPENQQVLFYGYTGIDASGGDGTSGGSGGDVELYTEYADSEFYEYNSGGSVVNHVPMDVSGGDGSNGAGGDAGDIYLETAYEYAHESPWEVAINRAALDLTGGTGTGGHGGSGGEAWFWGYSGVDNSGDLDTSGGAATGSGYDGGQAGDVSFLSDWGSVVNAGTLVADGGSSAAGDGGEGATLELVGTQTHNSGDLHANGGDGDAGSTDFDGGEGGLLFLHSTVATATEQTATTLEVEGGAGANPGANGQVIIDGMNVTDDWTN